MSEDRQAGHPEPEAVALLARYLANELPAALRTSVREHLADCAACRLELRQLARFSALETDDEASSEAAWEKARPALDARIAALLLGAERSKAPDTARTAADRGRWRAAARLRWWMPAAAVAALALIIVGVERMTGDTDLRDPQIGATVSGPVGPLRGGADLTMDIVAQRPVGEISAAPDTFVWLAPASCKRFTLEIYTPELRTVLRHEKIATPYFVVPDTLLLALVVDSLYLWSVQCFDELEPAGIMPESWFRIAP